MVNPTYNKKTLRWNTRDGKFHISVVQASEIHKWENLPGPYKNHVNLGGGEMSFTTLPTRYTNVRDQVIY